jgi:CheY-like chemotaxis protein
VRSLADDRRTVLVVDDDADIREALADTLEQEGYRVSSAGDGQDALEFLEIHPAPGLILLDWNMARMNAADFMAALSRDPRFAQVPVILVTADVRASEQAVAGYAGILKKPVKLELLLEVVARYAGAPAS